MQRTFINKDGIAGTLRSVAMGVALSAALSTVALSSAQAAPYCATQDDRPALQARMVQTELMVAGLSCGQSEFYNAFVTRFQSELANRGRALKAFFLREGGSGPGTKALNAFVTRLANEASIRLLSDMESYCTRTYHLFQEAQKLSRTDFASFVKSQPGVTKHGVPICQKVTENKR